MRFATKSINGNDHHLCDWLEKENMGQAGLLAPKVVPTYRRIVTQKMSNGVGKKQTTWLNVTLHKILRIAQKEET
jgi:hypothetical protein